MRNRRDDDDDFLDDFDDDDDDDDDDEEDEDLDLDADEEDMSKVIADKVRRRRVKITLALRQGGYWRKDGQQSRQRTLVAPCCWCHRVFPVSDLTFEHLTPRKAGGTNEQRNLALACRRCNNGRNPDFQARQHRLRREKLAKGLGIQARDLEAWASRSAVTVQ